MRLLSKAEMDAIKERTLVARDFIKIILTVSVKIADQAAKLP